MANVRNMRDRLRDLSTQTNLTPQQQEKLEQHIEEMSRMLSYNVNRDTDHGTSALQEATDQMPGLVINIDASQVLGQQAQVLSSLLQKPVEALPDKVAAAFKDLKTRWGDDTKFNIFMERFTNGLHKSAGDGAVNLAGLFIGEWNKATNQMEYRLAEQAKDKDYIDGKRLQALSTTKATHVTGFDASLDKRDGKTVIETEEALDRVAKVFGSITTNMVNNIDIKSINTFEEAFKNMLDMPNLGVAAVQKVIDRMYKESNRDERGIQALLGRIKATQNLNIRFDKETKSATVKAPAGTPTPPVQPQQQPPAASPAQAPQPPQSSQQNPPQQQGPAQRPRSGRGRPGNRRP